jgi:DNA-binding NarL/FixJ family response regulator
MITEKLQELNALKSRIAALEQEVGGQRSAELAALPAQYGFEDARAFTAAVLSASRGRRGRPAKTAKLTTTSGRKPRAKVTAQTRAGVKKLTRAGKTGSAIAEALGISLATVQNIKKASGLVAKRKK